MDPEKPKSDSTGERPTERPSAEQRVERLSRRERDKERGEQNADRQPDTSKVHEAGSDRTADSGAGEAGGSADSGGSADPGGSAGSVGSGNSADTGPAEAPPRLTERQRIEARERRRRGGRSRNRGSSGSGLGAARAGSRGDSGPGNPLSRGVRATLVEVKRTAGFVWALILTGLDRLGPAVRWLTAALLELLSAAGTALSGLGRLLARAASRLGEALVVLDRLLTPRRALVVVVGAGIAALIASQFLDFRATEVGQAAYDPIQDITRAPRIDVQTPMDAHSILLLAVGAIALTGLVGATVGGRRAFGGLIALAGLATIVVTLLIDLPKGLDVAVAEISYSGVVAVLLSGFWVQLAAGFVLATGGLGLLALSGQKQRSRARQSDPESGSGSGRDRNQGDRNQGDRSRDDRSRDDRRRDESRREKGVQGHGQRPLDAGSPT